MTQHSQNGEGKRPGWDVDGICNDHGRYLCSECAIPAPSLAREPATADVGREAIALIRDWRKLVRLENVKARAGTDLPRDAIDMFQADMYTRWPAWRVDEIIAALSRAAPSSDHSDDAAVDRFAAQMKAKLAKGRAKGRGGWDDPAQCSTDHLRRLLHDHLPKGDPIDVANFCMMLAHYGASAAAPSSEPAIAEGERDRVAAAICGRTVEAFREWAANGQTYPNSYQCLIDQVYAQADRVVAALATTPPTTNDAIPAGEQIEKAARYVLDNSRRGNASLNSDQYDADTQKLMTAYRDIIGKALASGFLSAAPSAPLIKGDADHG